MFKKRKNVSNELLQREREYLQNLTDLVQVK